MGMVPGAGFFEGRETGTSICVFFGLFLVKHKSKKSKCLRNGSRPSQKMQLDRGPRETGLRVRMPEISMGKNRCSFSRFLDVVGHGSELVLHDPHTNVWAPFLDSDLDTHSSSQEADGSVRFGWPLGWFRRFGSAGLGGSMRRRTLVIRNHGYLKRGTGARFLTVDLERKTGTTGVSFGRTEVSIPFF